MNPLTCGERTKIAESRRKKRISGAETREREGKRMKDNEGSYLFLTGLSGEPTYIIIFDLSSFPDILLRSSDFLACFLFCF